MALKWPNKDPDEQLDFSIDWSRYLDGDTITSVVWSIEDADGVKGVWSAGQVVNSLQHINNSNSNTVATIQVGLGDANTRYTIYCQVTTSSSLVTERKVLLTVRER